MEKQGKTDQWNVESIKKEQEKGKKIAIYCAGVHGKLFFQILKKCEIKVDVFLDIDSKKWGLEVCDGIFCMGPHGINNKDEYIILICIYKIYYEEVYRFVRSMGFLNIVNFNSVLDDIILCHAPLKYEELIQFCSKMGIADLYYTLSDRRNVFKDETVHSSGKIAVYTGIFGNYDKVSEPKAFPDQIDYYLISDCRPTGETAFKWIDARNVIPPDIVNPIKRNRYIKMHPHLLFPGYQYSVYIDGNVSVEKDLSSFAGKSRTGISAFLHPKRDCIFYEALAIVNFRRIVAEEAGRQMLRYLNEGMPIHYGMTEMTVIGREHNRPLCRKLMEEWWKEFDAGAQRDQLSFMYVMWKNGLGLSDLSLLGGDLGLCDKVKVKKHDRDSKWISNTV